MNIKQIGHSANLMQQRSYTARNVPSDHADEFSKMMRVSDSGANKRKSSSKNRASDRQNAELQRVMEMIQKMMKLLSELIKKLEDGSGRDSNVSQSKPGMTRPQAQIPQPQPQPNPSGTPANTGSGYTPFQGDPFTDSANFLQHMEQTMLRPTPQRQAGDPVFDLLNSPETSIPENQHFDVNANPPTARELEQLTEKYGVEFAMAHVQGKGLVLGSGRPRGVNPPGDRHTAIKIVHTHPREAHDQGKKGASGKDVDRMNNFRNQEIAYVVTIKPGADFGTMESYSKNDRMINSIQI